MDVVIVLTNGEVTDIEAEIAAMAEPRPSVDEYLAAIVRQQIIDPITQRQQRYRVDRVVGAVRDIIGKLTQLTPEQQEEVRVIAEAATDERLAANASQQ
jgi:hypothetical protein